VQLLHSLLASNKSAKGFENRVRNETTMLQYIHSLLAVFPVMLNRYFSSFFYIMQPTYFCERH
jgi:hypothetical protein